MSDAQRLIEVLAAQNGAIRDLMENGIDIQSMCIASICVLCGSIAHRDAEERHAIAERAMQTFAELGRQWNTTEEARSKTERFIRNLLALINDMSAPPAD